MQNETKLGFNRTGMDMSPMDGAALKSITEQTPPDIPGSEEALAELRSSFIKEAERIGSVPLPGTVKGIASTTVGKLTGKHLEVLIDKLGERIAFERTGVRLYDSLIAKAQAIDAASELVETLMRFRAEELKHLATAIKSLKSLGADPTAQTPCADVVGVASMGILKVIADPRTTMAQSLNALLTAELTDNSGWELLIKLAQQLAQDEMISDFQQALKEEQVHLYTIRYWLENAVLEEAS